MKLVRRIIWFGKENEELFGELNIDHIGLEKLKEIFTAKADDPLMYDPYDIREREARLLQEFIPLEFNFIRYIYELDCVSVEE